LTTTGLSFHNPAAFNKNKTVKITFETNSSCPPSVKIMFAMAVLTFLIALVNLIFSLNIPLIWIFFPSWGMLVLLSTLSFVVLAIRGLDSFVGRISRKKVKEKH
jgi:predicted neutral ceramidase superfamily lipid hydrolase